MEVLEKHTTAPVEKPSVVAEWDESSEDNVIRGRSGVKKPARVSSDNEEVEFESDGSDEITLVRPKKQHTERYAENRVLPEAADSPALLVEKNMLLLSLSLLSLRKKISRTVNSCCTEGEIRRRKAKRNSISSRLLVINE